MERLIPEASREILKRWQKLGVKFKISGIEAKDLYFTDRPSIKYDISEQPVPEGLTVEQVRAMWEQGLVLEFNCAELKNPEWHRVDHSFNWAGGWAGTDLLLRLQIPTQPIPKELLTVPMTELPAEEYVLEAKWDPTNPVEWFPHSFTFKATEFDPHGTDPHSPGAKLDAGKNRLGLVLGGFAMALEEIGKVGTYGAEKYSPNGWKSVPDGIERYDDAMWRHWFAQQIEGPTDPSSELRHQAQIAWNALAVLELMLREENKNG